jgi:hypothetical protein
MWYLCWRWMCGRRAGRKRAFYGWSVSGQIVIVDALGSSHKPRLMTATLAIQGRPDKGNHRRGAIESHTRCEAVGWGLLCLCRHEPMMSSCRQCCRRCGTGSVCTTGAGPRESLKSGTRRMMVIIKASRGKLTLSIIYTLAAPSDCPPTVPPVPPAHLTPGWRSAATIAAAVSIHR